MPIRDAVRVLHRDGQLLVLYKPTGLPTTSPDGSRCLTEVARKVDAGAPRMHPSSRLDAEVSGVVVFARTRRATQALLAARRAGRYSRLYVGLAVTPPRPPEGCWEGPIAIDPRDRRRRIVVEAGAPGARDALTRYSTGATSDDACALWLRPGTGRTHQLRVHAASAGSPLLGDVHYGGTRRIVRADGRVVTARRTMLHCIAVRVPDVERGGGLLLEAPVPEDLRDVWRGLGGEDAALEPGARLDTLSAMEKSATTRSS